MKSFKFILSLSIILSCLFACSKGDHLKNPENSIVTRSNESMTIPLNQFEDWKNRWQNSAAQYLSSNEMHYFDIPIQSITEVLDQGSVDEIKAYIGLDKEHYPHLMLLGSINNKPNFDIITNYTSSCPPHCFIVEVSENNSSNTNTETSSSSQAIPFSQFEAWKSSWQNLSSEYIVSNDIYYFDIPVQSITDILALESTDKLRAYLGMDSNITPHLMFVGVNNGQSNYNLITDYTRACPPHCY